MLIRLWLFASLQLPSIAWVLQQTAIFEEMDSAIGKKRKLDRQLGIESNASALAEEDDKVGLLFLLEWGSFSK